MDARLTPYWPRLKRAAAFLGSGVALFALALFGLYTYLNSEAMRGELRNKLNGAAQGRGVRVELGDTLEVTVLGRVSVGPLRVYLEGERDPVVTVKRVRLRPRYRALIQGRTEVASVLLEDATVDAGERGARLRTLVERLQRGRRTGHADPAAATAVEPPKLRAERLTFLLHGIPHLEGALTLGPVDGELVVGREESARTVEATARLPGGGAVSVAAIFGPRQPVHVEVTAVDLTPSLLPPGLRQRLPFHVVDGIARLSFVVDLEPEGKTATLHFDVGLENLVVEAERLASEPVGPFILGAKGRVRFDRDRHRLKLEDTILTLGHTEQLPLHLSAEGSYRAPYPFRLDAHVDGLPYQDAVDALPRQLGPGERAPRIDGPLSAQVLLQGQGLKQDGWTLDVKLELGAMKQSARGKSFALKDEFLYQAVDGQGQTRDVWVGPRNPAFVPLSALPPYVVRAVTTSEDAGFYGHHGFDFQEIRDSIIAAADGTRVRGASTITQQLAKNLFLSREKTLSRKVREALITLALEAALSKQRLLEIYLNIIEWGPGIHGIGEAARYYFGRDARALTPKQAAFLATIIPNPIRYHVYFTRGALTETWEARVRDLLEKMHAVGVLNDAEFEDAEAAPITFRSHG